MTWQLCIEDFVVLVVLVGVLQLAAESLRRRLRANHREHQVRRHTQRFTQFFMVYVLVLVLFGVLHQMGIIEGRTAYSLFGVLFGLGAVVWIRWQRIASRQPVNHVS